MKIAVPIFAYHNFQHFSEELKHRGYYTINLGDNMQTIALRQLLRRLGVGENDIVAVNRDELRQYAGPEVRLIMNGFYPDHCFPISPGVSPIFVGFSTTWQTIIANLKYFRRHEPIG